MPNALIIRTILHRRRHSSRQALARNSRGGTDKGEPYHHLRSFHPIHHQGATMCPDLHTSSFATDRNLTMVDVCSPPLLAILA
jgi:hypothetical protein